MRIKNQPCRRLPALLAALLSTAALCLAADPPPNPATNPAAPTSAPAGPLTLTSGRQTITVPMPADLTETADSTPARRVLQADAGKITLILSLLPLDQPTDPAAVASLIEANQGAMQQTMGANLVSPPSSQPDPRFAMVMHWQVRISTDKTVDATRRWLKVGPATVDSVVQITSADGATVKQANDAVVAMLMNIAGAPNETAPNAAASSRPKLTGGIEYDAPDQFEDIGVAQGGAAHDYVSNDRATEMILSVMPPGTMLDSGSPPTLLANAKHDLAAQTLLSPPELVPAAPGTVAIHWSINKNGKPAQAFRLFRKVGKQFVVCCVLLTTGDVKAVQQLGEQTLAGMTAPDPPPAPEAVKPPTPPANHPPIAGGTTPTHTPAGSADFQTKMNARAQAALDAAKKLQADGKDDDAYARYKFILSEYPKSSAASEAQQAITTYESDATFMAKHNVKNTVSDADKAAAMLAMADNYSSAGKLDAARAKYQDIITKYPGTPSAVKAKKRIEDMDKAGGK